VVVVFIVVDDVAVFTFVGRVWCVKLRLASGTSAYKWLMIYVIGLKKSEHIMQNLALFLQNTSPDFSKVYAELKFLEIDKFCRIRHSFFHLVVPALLVI